MTVQSVTNQYNTILILDEILQDIPERATEELLAIEETYQSYKEELNLELKATDRVWLEFQAGQCEQFGKAAKSILYRIVNSSIGCSENSIAAANAITILKVMRVSFSCIDLRGVQIPGADLSGAILDRADLSGANLENVDLRFASLNCTDMSNAVLEKVKFDNLGILIHKDKVLSSIVSPNCKYLVSEDAAYMYFWQLSNKACIKIITKQSSPYLCFDEKIFTPDGRFLFIYNNEQHIDIWPIGDFTHIKKLKISHEKVRDISFSFSPNGANFIAVYSTEKDRIATTHLMLWEIQKEEIFLNFNLKNEISIPYQVLSTVYFSKKFPIFYCFKIAQSYNVDIGISLNINVSIDISLSIRNIEALSEIANIPIGSITVTNLATLLTVEKTANKSNWLNKLISLDSCNMSTNNEELIFIAIGNSIYSITVEKTDEQKFNLKSVEITKVISEIDIILNMHTLANTHDLIYMCNETIYVYSIKNRQHIGRFRLLDRHLRQLPVSSDGTNIYLSYFNKISIQAIETLKSNKYIAYETDSIASCFSPDVQSIISLSRNCYKQTYDLETGNILKSGFLQNMSTHISTQLITQTIFSQNTKYILTTGKSFSSYGILRMIDTETEKTHFEITIDDDIFALSNNSEYLALVESKKERLYFYKTSPEKQCIGKFNIKCSPFSQIALAADFRNVSKIALIDSLHKVIVCSFVFEGEILKFVSKKEFLVEEDDSNILQLMFTENDHKLIVACKKKLVICSIKDNFLEEYSIQANRVAISLDGSLLIYYNNETDDVHTLNHQLCLWSITQKKILFAHALSLALDKLQISSDNRYIVGTVKNGGMYVWKILKNTLRLLWRTSHNLQAQGLILGDNNLDEGVKEDLIKKMGAIKL